MLLAPKTEEGARSPGTWCPQKQDTRPGRNMDSPQSLRGNQPSDSLVLAR